MPWKECSIMYERMELVELMQAESACVAELCRRFGVSRKTAYKWLKRCHGGGKENLADRSRRPRSSPGRTDAAMEARVAALRQTHRGWGARKIARVLDREGLEGVPSPSTITAVLRRRGLLDASESLKHKPWVRFEHEHPNDLWQMDFKGHFGLSNGSRCHPLTVLDDHSRFAVGLRACPDERAATVLGELTGLFERYGLPERMLMDNGAPWGDDAQHRHTVVTVHLMRLGIGVSHGRPYHPQTQGKDERFHRTMVVELLPRPHEAAWGDLAQAQERFDKWRGEYNQERPHEALGMETPLRRYQPSHRPLPARMPAGEYAPGDHVRRVQDSGRVCFQGRTLRVSKAFRGYPIGLRATTTDGVYRLMFCRFEVGSVDLRGSVRGAALSAGPPVARLAALGSLPADRPTTHR